MYPSHPVSELKVAKAQYAHLEAKSFTSRPSQFAPIRAIRRALGRRTQR